MHAVINPVIVLFLGWEVGTGREEVRMRRQTQEERGDEGGQVIRLKPSSYFWSESASKCLYCLWVFAPECRTMLRRVSSRTRHLFICQAARGGCFTAPDTYI